MDVCISISFEVSLSYNKIHVFKNVYFMIYYPEYSSKVVRKEEGRRKAYRPRKALDLWTKRKTSLKGKPLTWDP